MSYWSVEFGPKLDDLTPIPGNDVISVSPPSVELEPGVPGVPTVDKISFELDNLDSAGNEKFPNEWFTNNSNQTDPIFDRELFFKVTIGENTFIGIYATHSYTSRFEKAKVNVKGLFSIVKSRNFPALGTFELGEKEIKAGNMTSTVTHTDLEGNNLQFTNFSFLHQISELGSTTITDDYGLHVFGSNSTTQIRNVYLKIGKITLLTECKLRQVTGDVSDEEGNVLGQAEFIEFSFRMRDEELADGLIPIGTFVNADQDAKLAVGNVVDVKVFDYDVGNGNALFTESDMPNLEYKGGIPFEAGQTTVANTNKQIFFLLETFTNAYNRIFEQFYNDPAGVDHFDITKANDKFVFWTDLITWFNGDDVEDTITSLMLATGSYLYEDEGMIIMQDRLLEEQFIEPNVPADAVILDRGRYFPDGDISFNNGFAGYSYKFSTRIPMVNLTRDDEQEKEVSLTNAVNSQKTTELEPKIYHSNNVTSVFERLDINNTGNPVFFRYRHGIGGSSTNLTFGVNDFVNSAKVQVERFAVSWKFGTETRIAEIEKNIYTDLRVGGFLLIPKKSDPNLHNMFLVRKESTDFNMLSTVELQFLKEFDITGQSAIFDVTAITTAEVTI